MVSVPYQMIILDKITNIFIWIEYQMKMLKHRPRLWWDSLYIRADEFDNSLSMNGYAILSMRKEDRTKYIKDLCRRRQIAHERDMEQKDKKNDSQL